MRNKEATILRLATTKIIDITPKAEPAGIIPNAVAVNTVL
jgi:hypothetical protein